MLSLSLALRRVCPASELYSQEDTVCWQPLRAACRLSLPRTHPSPDPPGSQVRSQPGPSSFTLSCSAVQPEHSLSSISSNPHGPPGAPS